MEKAKRFRSEISVPSQLIEMIKNSKKRESKFKVIEMTMQDFFSTSALEKVVNRKAFTDDRKVEWLKTCWIRLEKENPQVLKMKQTHNEDYRFSTLDLNRRNIEPPLLYPNGRTLTKKKLKDLVDLSQCIPPVHHPFYKDLKGSDDVEDIGLLTEMLDRVLLSQCVEHISLLVTLKLQLL
jgi:hypothetical protein